MLLHDENVELEKTVKAGGELPPICPRKSCSGRPFFDSCTNHGTNRSRQNKVYVMQEKIRFQSYRNVTVRLEMIKNKACNLIKRNAEKVVCK